MADTKRAPDSQGRWELGKYRGDPTIWGSDQVDDDVVTIRSRQDCDDLIALLQRVKERLPDGK